MADEKPEAQSGAVPAQRGPSTQPAEKPEFTAPMFWMQSPDSGEKYPVDSAAEMVNMRAMGYTIARAPRGMPEATGSVA